MQDVELRKCHYLQIICRHCGEVRIATIVTRLMEQMPCPICNLDGQTPVLLGTGQTRRPLPIVERFEPQDAEVRRQPAQHLSRFVPNVIETTAQFQINVECPTQV